MPSFVSTNNIRSPDGAQRNPAFGTRASAPDFASLHPGYGSTQATGQADNELPEEEGAQLRSQFETAQRRAGYAPWGLTHPRLYRSTFGELSSPSKGEGHDKIDDTEDDPETPPGRWGTALLTSLGALRHASAQASTQAPAASGLDYAVFTELSPESKLLKGGWNTRVFTNTDSRKGNAIQCDFATGIVTVAPGLYHISAMSIVAYNSGGEPPEMTTIRSPPRPATAGCARSAQALS